ncbi:MAG: DUF3313 domain-containing protein [Alphaproteobacteria bacterium]|uniref:DUF3313 family protein n=1 Tax=Brevundimonas sp. TaxID=1871086 RepID=UPI001A27EF45|nr:DUF3313 family protein [Brevundimonas sp.]MBU1271574.1 DUF3313 domain-containing protein [Alphaproteobacteria bacterium]MBJ7318784.1 DUF3313 family protein [Brevundimonas sp.]MBU1520322.1 DUF3313 domain-containing protein [Alphaproteobacteria bacterium]MBU2030809.1 DUF3313 domain-containing protein [Alphaproteobacteria bacterium]MBU2163501.1 DUF3313 domain-containing protein [Alphaproteobacteria bacterium]
MSKPLFALVPLLATTTLAACHTTPPAQSGYLARYDGLRAPPRSLSASVRQRRDDVASDAVGGVFLEPAVFAPGVGDRFSPAERAMVLREVDRQICFEVSERFTIAPAPTTETATLRTAVVRLQPTGRAGSVASAAVGFFVPVINLRAPMSTGGLAVETELLEAGTGRQIAALSWARNAQYVGRDSPSLSRIGDALQMAEPMGDAVGDAFASKARKVNDIPNPDPCAVYGPRRNVGRTAAGFVVSGVTGLYSPEVEGAGAALRPAADAASTETPQ